MPSPCGIIFNGKEYSYEDFAAYLHEGGLDKLVADKVVDDRAFKGKQTPIEQPTTDERIGKEVSFEHAGSERTGKVQGVDEKGNLKIKDSRGINYTVAPDAARSVDLVEQAKKSIDSSLKQLENLSKSKQEQPEKMPPMQKSVIGMDIPFKALGMADKQIAALTGKIEDGISKSFRRGMGHSNKFVRTAANLGQGLFRNAALTGEEIVRRRLGLGAINAAPLKALKFYENAADIVGKTPESLRNVHMVLDPEVYSKRGETPLTEANLSPAEKNLYEVLRNMNNMIHDWHYANGRISEETYLKNKDKYAPRFYDNIEFEGYPDEIKQAFEDYSKKQNFSYIKERQAFEDVMNENKIYEDPVYGTSMRLAQMLRNQAVMQYAADIATTTKTYSEGDANIPENYVKLEGGGKFGNIKTYGELTNKYVPRDVAEDFKGYIFLNEFTNKVYDVGKAYDKLWVRQALKKSKTLYNPITQLGNIGSNYIFAMMNGIDPISYQGRKSEAAKIVKDKSPLYVQLVEEGVLGSDIITKDIKEASKGKPEKTGIRKALSDIDESISDFYGSRDEIAKVAAYLAHTKDYGLSHKEAVDKVYSGFQNYNNVGRYFFFGSKLPVFWNPFFNV